MSPTALLLAFGALVLAGVLLSIELGRRLRCRDDRRSSGRTAEGIGALEGALFALLGLLIAFTFAGAADRFDGRRHLVVDEANAIGTAYLRLDLLPAPERVALKEELRRYLDARLAAYRALPDTVAAFRYLEVASDARIAIWNRAVAASQAASTPMTGQLLLPALNEMFDLATTRTAAAHLHPPIVIFVMLVALALACSVLAGYGMGANDRRNWLHPVVFALVLTLTVYVIVDMEYPRLGFIRVDAFDRVLVEVRNEMR
ncbi:MAG: DUF4239 domain-containing protein [Candidatus Eiseniibacteriota bacterium]